MHKIKYLIIVGSFFSCNKIELETKNFIGNFYGQSKVSNESFYINEINVPLKLNIIESNYLMFNDSCKLDFYNDSIQGTIYFPEKDYEIHPYVIGEMYKTASQIFFFGHYAAVYENNLVSGNFNISSEY